MKNLSYNKLLILSLAGFLMTAPQVFAENDYELTDESANKNKELSENEIIDDMCDRMANEEGDSKLGRQSLRVITLKATGKKIYVPLWYNDVSNPEENRDPFRPKIKKEVILPPKKDEVAPPQKQENDKREVKKVIPPLKIFVKGIVGNEGIRYAVIDFENEERTVVKDQIVEGKFKVVDIYSDRIVVYSNAEERRYTFKIGGEKK